MNNHNLFYEIFPFFFFFAFIHGFWLFLSKYFEGEKRDFQLIYQYKYRSNFGKFHKFRW